ncbi:hypothetical protein CNR30_06985 [Levilactobacillus brevis]|uniref:hypothetical protein n=1 Tax=Levilactobacillus brevis TaxID=1580 RepID=UPI0005A88992|nr:hypothetical protein [Levilactobacillus brevis]RDF14207.1 hypothetical protein CNR30_06985 [Levilactobacillus brevis]
MADSSRTIMTDAGFALETRVRADETKMQFTRATISTDDHFSDTDDALAKLTELSNIQQDGKVTAVQVINTTTVYVQVDVNQAESKADYQMRSAALYAKDDDGTEVLYGVTVLQDPVFVHKDADGSYLGFGINTTVGRASNVVVVVDPANMVTQQVFESTMKNYYTKAEVDAKFVTDDDFASKLPQNIATTDAANTFAKSQTLAGGATDGKGNAYATTKDVATDLNNGLSTKVNVSDMRKPASDVAGIEEVNAKQDKIGYTPADDSKVVHDNHDGTEQLNGFQIQPFNKLVDTIGGRNLLINTAQLNDSTVCLDRTSNISDTYLGLNIYQTNGVWVGVKIYWSYLASKIKTGTNYVMSEYVRNTSPTTSVNIGLYGADTGVVFNSSNVNHFIATLPPNSGWTRISAPVNIASFPTNVSGVFRFENATNLTDGYVQFAGLKFEQGSVATDWTPAPEDKVNVADMRKPASDVAGIEEVNAKQDKLTITPADDSKVAHLSGANNFDTVPTVNNNPLLLASSLPSDLARLSQDANFTAKLQQNGQDVALANNTIARNPNTGVVSEPTDFTKLTVNGGKSVATRDDLKSLEASAWRPLKLVSSTSGTILFKDNGDGTASLTGSAIFNVAQDKDNFVAEVDAPDGYVFTSVDWKISIDSSTQIVGINSQYAVSATGSSNNQALKVRIQDGNLLIGGSNNWNQNNLITFNAFNTNFKTASLAGSPATIGITKLN